MQVWIGRLALLATAGATFFLLLVFAPALEAPFLVPKFATLEVAATLGLFAFVLQRTTAADLRWSRGVTLGAWAVAATTVASFCWALRAPLGTPYALAAFARWGSLFGIVCGVSVVERDEAETTVLLEIVTLAAAVVASVGLLQHVGLLPFDIPIISLPGSTFGNRNLAAEVVALALPLGVPLLSRPRSVRALVLVALAAEVLFIAVTRARSAWLGAGLGFAVAVWLERARWSRRAFFAGAGFVVLLGVAASLPGHFNADHANDQKRYASVGKVIGDSFDTKAPVVRTRLGFWRRTARMVYDHPIFGVGPGNWPLVFPVYAEPNAARDGVTSPTVVPRQAHDDLVERTGETGILGGLALLGLGLAVGVATVRRLRSDPPSQRSVTAGAAGSLVALVATSIASFPLEMPGTLMLSGIALGLVVRDPRELRVRWPRSVGVPVGAALVLLLAATLVRVERQIRASRWLLAAERALHDDLGVVGAKHALAALDQALEAEPETYVCELRKAQMLIREQRTTEAIAAAHRALAIEPNAANAWASLAAAEFAAHDAIAARRDATHAITLVNDYSFALFTRADAAEALGDPESARADRERIAVLAASSNDADTVVAAKAMLKRLAARTLPPKP